MDPSHVAFAHHGVQGNREKPMITHMNLEGKMTLPEVTPPPYQASQPKLVTSMKVYPILTTQGALQALKQQ